MKEGRVKNSVKQKIKDLATSLISIAAKREMAQSYKMNIDHIKLNAPLTSDIEGIAKPVSHWVKTCKSSLEVGKNAAEAVKKALIKDYEFFSWLEQFDYKGLREKKNVINLIHKSSKIKVELVQQDEKEKGQRALLNFGHTFAHALESANNYSNNLLHGEAVIIGCCLALKLSREYDLITTKESKRVINHFKKLNYLTEINHIKSNVFNTKNLIDIMKQDKKVCNKKLNFILLKRIGEGIIFKNVNMNKVKKILTNSINV